MVKEEDEPIDIEGCAMKGSGYSITSNIDDWTKPLICRGVASRKKIRACREQSRDFYYIDTGYFGNFPSAGNPGGKKLWHRMVKNDMQKSWLEDYPSDRWQELCKHDPRLEWKGWKKKGSKILLVVPNNKACVAHGTTLEDWMKLTLDTLKEHTDRKIEIRYKGTRSYRNTDRTIYDALNDDIYCTVVYNSIAALESVAYGIPAVVSVPCAASPLAANDLSKVEKLFRPNESIIKQHCYSLAYGQFTPEEIINGYAWSIVK